MSENQPREYDAVLGGGNQAPVDGVVLGGIEGAKQRFASNSENYRILALEELIRYGEEGLDLVINGLRDSSENVKIKAYKLLRKIYHSKAKQAIKGFNPYQFFQLLQSPKFYSDSGNIIITEDGYLVSCRDAGSGYGVYSDITNQWTGVDLIECNTWKINENYVNTIQENSNSKSITNKSLNIKQLPLRYAEFGKNRTAYLYSLLICPDAKTLIATGNQPDRLSDTIIDVFDINTEKLIYTVYGHKKIGSGKKPVINVSADCRIFATSNMYDKTAIIWELKSGKKLFTFKGHRDIITAIAISQDNSMLATGAEDGAIKLWDLHTGKFIRTLTHSVGCSIKCLVFSRDGQTLVNGDSCSSIYIVDLNMKKTANFQHIYSQRDSIRSVSIGSYGQILVSCNGYHQTYGEIKVWDLFSGNKLADLPTNSISGVEITSAISSTDGQIIASDGQINIWGLP